MGPPQQAQQVNICSAYVLPAPKPVLQTPAYKLAGPGTVGEEASNTTRRSGRLATKQKIAGKKKPEQMAQDVLAKKLGVLEDVADRDKETKNRFMKLFEGPLSQDVMQAMEDFLMAMNIDRQVGKTPAKVAATKAK